MSEAFEGVAWLHLAGVLAVGAATIVACAAVVAWRARSGPRRRALWQAATVAVLLLVAAEMTGLGPGAMAYLRNRAADAAPAPVGRAEPAAGGVVYGTQPLETLPLPIAAPLTDDNHTPGAARSSAAATTDGPPVLGAWLALLWGLGAAVVAARVAVARALLVWMRFRCREHPGGPVVARARELASRMGLGRRVRIVASPSLTAPMAFGVVRPTVVLPPDFGDGLGAAEQEAVLAHELAHLAGQDPTWLLAADVTTVLLWWHPLVWLARRRLAEACESAADEASLLVDDGPRRLAACLLRWGRRVAPRRAAAILGIGGEFRSGLGRRLARLVTLQRRTERPAVQGLWRLVRTGGPVGLVLVAMLATAWARPEPPEKGEEPMEILRNAWTTSMVGMTVLAIVASGPDTALADDGREEGEAVRRVERERDRERVERREGDRERDEGREWQRRREEAREREERRDLELRRQAEERERRRNEMVHATIHRLESQHAALDFKEVPLPEAVAFLNRLAEGVEIVLADGVPERRVTLRVERINIWHALREITGPGIRLEVLPERVVLLPAGREHRVEGREGGGEPGHEQALRERAWQREVDGCRERLAALRRLRHLAQEHGAPDQRELVEHLIHEQERHYGMLLQRRGRRDEGEREREEGGDRRRWHDPDYEGERPREGDREREERREWQRRREGDRDRDERQEWQRRREGEERARRERNREGEERHRGDREGEG